MASDGNTKIMCVRPVSSRRESVKRIDEGRYLAIFKGDNRADFHDNTALLLFTWARGIFPTNHDDIEI